MLLNAEILEYILEFELKMHLSTDMELGARGASFPSAKLLGLI